MALNTQIHTEVVFLQWKLPFTVQCWLRSWVSAARLSAPKLTASHIHQSREAQSRLCLASQREDWGRTWWEGVSTSLEVKYQGLKGSWAEEKHRNEWPNTGTLQSKYLDTYSLKWWMWSVRGRNPEHCAEALQPQYLQLQICYLPQDTLQ